jgi:UDP-N-acetylmuramyl pentapeptide synthase
VSSPERWTVAVSEAASDVAVIDGWYNAMPMSMPAALDHVAASAPGRPV